jgi:hypothetical protein
MDKNTDDESVHQAHVRRLLDLGELMDPSARGVLHTSLLLEWTAELREAREEYLADFTMLRERGHQFKPDQEILAMLDAEIAALRAMADAME